MMHATAFYQTASMGTGSLLASVDGQWVAMVPLGPVETELPQKYLNTPAGKAGAPAPEERPRGFNVERWADWFNYSAAVQEKHREFYDAAYAETGLPPEGSLDPNYEEHRTKYIHFYDTTVVECHRRAMTFYSNLYNSLAAKWGPDTEGIGTDVDASDWPISNPFLQEA